MFRISKILAILIILSNLSYSQENQRSEYIFKWFPAGEYRQIIHQDNELIKSAESYRDFQNFFGPFSTGDQKVEGIKAGEKESKRLAHFDRGVRYMLSSPIGINSWHPYLPESFRSELISATIGQNIYINDSPEKGASKAKLIPNRKQNGKEAPPSVITTNRSNGHCGVFRFSDAKTLIKSAVEKGAFAPTGNKIAKNPLYIFKSGIISFKKHTLYILSPSPGEILVATKPGILSKMLKAGNGEDMNLIDDHCYRDLEVIVPRLGALWSISAYGKTRERIIDEMKASNYSLEIINKQIEKEKETPNLKIISWNLGNTINRLEILNFADSKIAELVYKNYQEKFSMSMDGAPAFNKLQQKLKTRRNLTRESNNIEVSLLIDSPLVEAMNKAGMDIEKSMKDNDGRLIYRQGKGTVMLGGRKKSSKRK